MTNLSRWFYSGAATFSTTLFLALIVDGAISPDNFVAFYSAVCFTIVLPYFFCAAFLYAAIDAKGWEEEVYKKVFAVWYVRLIDYSMVILFLVGMALFYY